MQRMKRAAIVAAWALGCHFGAITLIVLFVLLTDGADPSPFHNNSAYWLVFGALLVTTSRRWTRWQRAGRFAGFALLALMTMELPSGKQGQLSEERESLVRAQCAQGNEDACRTLAYEYRPIRMDELCEQGYQDACEDLSPDLRTFMCEDGLAQAC